MVSRILLLISMISMVIVGTNAECMGCGTRYECKGGKYLYTYTGDQGSTHSIVSDTWPSAGTLGDHAVYTKADTPCFGGNSEWPLVKTPAMESLEYIEQLENGFQQLNKGIQCLVHRKMRDCKGATGCVWSRKQKQCSASPQQWETAMYAPM